MTRAGLVSLVLLACGGASPPGAESPRSLLDTLADAFERRDRESVMACFDRSTPDGDVAARLFGAFAAVLGASDKLEAAVTERFGADAAAKSVNEEEMAGLMRLPARLREAEVRVEGERATAGEIELIQRDGAWLVAAKELSEEQRKRQEKLIQLYEASARVYADTSIVDEAESFEKFQAALFGRLMELKR